VGVLGRGRARLSSNLAGPVVRNGRKVDGVAAGWLCSRFAVQDRRLQERTSLFYLQLDRIVGLLEALRGEAEYLGSGA
jgi:hypothetical protein